MTFIQQIYRNINAADVRFIRKGRCKTMLKSILTAFIETVYVFMFLLFPFILMSRRQRIKDKQSRRRHERKKELAEHELQYQCLIIHKLYELEKPKINRQSITVKGIFANDYYNDLNA